MLHQPLLLDRSFPVQLILGILLPVAYGALTGWSLSQDETLYLVLSLLGVLGGIGAGYDHVGADQGFVRGVLGGALFGISILVAHSLVDEVAKAKLPDPQFVLPIVTTILGALFGAIGGGLRARAEKPAVAPAAA